MIQRVIQAAANHSAWWAYRQKVASRWRFWDSKGGGKHALGQIAPYKLLSREAFNPFPLDDPLYLDPHYGANIPAQKVQPHPEYVYHVRKPCTIEPEFGYVIMEPGVLIPESLAWSYLARTPGRQKFFSGVPSGKEYEDARQGKVAVQEEPIVVSLRHVFGSNYAHCLAQLMPALCLLEECGVSPEIPIVVSPLLGKAPFFQEMIQRGELRKRRWIVQGTAPIHAQEVIFAATEWPTQSLLNRFLDMIEVPQGDPNGRKRLFILRRTRQFSNLDALQPTLERHGFEPVRTEELTFDQQLNLFGQAEVVCGAPGAGFTNIVSRRSLPAKILEVRASNEWDMFFYGLAKTCGYAHGYLVGSPYETADRFSNFSVEPERFEAFISGHIGGS